MNPVMGRSLLQQSIRRNKVRQDGLTTLLFRLLSIPSSHRSSCIHPLRQCGMLHRPLNCTVQVIVLKRLNEGSQPLLMSYQTWESSCAWLLQPQMHFRFIEHKSPTPTLHRPVQAPDLAWLADDDMTDDMDGLLRSMAVSRFLFPNPPGRRSTRHLPHPDRCYGTHPPTTTSRQSQARLCLRIPHDMGPSYIAIYI